MLASRNVTGDRAGPVETPEAQVMVHTPAPWLTPREAAQRARVGPKTIYREVQAGKLRAARIGGRRELRLRPEWVDEWLSNSAEPLAA